MASREKLIRPKPSNVQLMFNSHGPLAETQRAERAQEMVSRKGRLCSTGLCSPQEGDP